MACLTHKNSDTPDRRAKPHRTQLAGVGRQAGPDVCAHVRAVTPRLRPFERLVFRARLNGELLGEIEIFEAQLRDAVVVAERVPELERIPVSAVMAFSPLSVSEAGLWVVEVAPRSWTAFRGS